MAFTSASRDREVPISRMLMWLATATAALVCPPMTRLPGHVDRVARAGRISLDGTQARSDVGRRSRFQPSTLSSDIVCAPNSKAFRRALEGAVREDDEVLEIGCQLGSTTSLLAARAARVIGVDMERDLAGRG